MRRWRGRRWRWGRRRGGGGARGARRGGDQSGAERREIDRYAVGENRVAAAARVAPWTAGAAPVVVGCVERAAVRPGVDLQSPLCVGNEVVLVDLDVGVDDLAGVFVDADGGCR